jgi:ribonuclease HII
MIPEALEQAVRTKGVSLVAGIDEAGRGPLAGPVVAAAVLFPETVMLPGINDSKKLSSKKRDVLFDDIYRHAISVGIGIVDPLEIDRINILQATLLSMRMAVENLNPSPHFLLIDGNVPIQTTIPQKTVKGGDRRCASIAAASIVAKVTRDRLMALYDEEYPEFGFKKHKGYGTKAHCEAIRTYGYCRIHRKTFRRVREYVHNP